MTVIDSLVDQNGIVLDVRSEKRPVVPVESAPEPMNVKPLVFLLPIPIGLLLMILEVLIRSHLH